MILRLTTLLRKLNHLIQMEVEGKKKKDRKKVGCFVDIHSLWNSEDVAPRLMCKVKEDSVTLFFPYQSRSQLFLPRDQTVCSTIHNPVHRYWADFVLSGFPK